MAQVKLSMLHKAVRSRTDLEAGDPAPLTKIEAYAECEGYHFWDTTRGHRIIE